MKSKLAVFFVCCACPLLGRDVVAVVTELSSRPIPGVPDTERLAIERKETAFFITLEGLRAVPFQGPHGVRVSPITKYSIKKSKSDGAGMGSADLCDGDRPIRPALNLLYQCSLDGKDLVIVRREHNSFSSPIRWLAALSGHPVQVSEIWAIVIDGSNDPKETQLISKPASYKWAAAFFEKEPKAPEPTAPSGRG